jgi:hypothetical protein
MTAKDKLMVERAKRLGYVLQVKELINMSTLEVIATRYCLSCNSGKELPDYERRKVWDEINKSELNYC